MTNVLLSDWATPFSLPPFDVIRDEDFTPAFETALEAARARLAEIAGNPEPASFSNTIEALELAEGELNRVAGVFYNLAGAEATPAREALQRELAPKLAAWSSERSLNPEVFARIETLWESRGSLDLTADQERLLLLYRRGLVRAGAGLSAVKAARMREINSRLAVIGTAFSQNLLADERSWFMDLAEADLEGLPEFLVTAARDEGAARGRPGPVMTLSRSLIVPFLQFSPRRDLRERAFRAWMARGESGGETDNRAIVAETLALRHERAQLLGYADFAAFKLETEMAKQPEAVEELLMQVWAPAKAQAEADAKRLEVMLHADGHNGVLEPWDWRYYSEKRRRAEHDLDEAALKPYLSLEAMIAAAFDCANRLFGLEFRPLDVPLYHPDARAWEVTKGGAHVAVFIGDYFARSSKRSGAWMSAFRNQRKFGGRQSPVIVNVCNFVKGNPALLSWDDARTLFHEFGHALHGMLSDVTYESVSGTSVARDFVELPSQLYEHWLAVPEVLEKHARHYKTGAPMPADLRERLLGAQTYDQGFSTVEYLASALVDLDFHRGAPPADPMARQAEVLARIGMPRSIVMRHATPHFGHVFSGGGYAAGYYSYMWSEVMDADAFEAFEEAGSAFDPGMAAALYEHILSKGGSVEADELYRAFRGRLPGPEALLKGRGLDKVTS
ncbi:M3 family metallopeptidase [Falsigemmobacter intermedius]|uniref:M3 family peptidase n=1 Tax=Falsigemmobacter intermedius TaxID=1553448 RepID=A0A3S3UJ02_9RHOB|nr:M3 family metallopeptidase [Falsigemmobacter intermedius]RWY42366.1 M3 family peptidase [Falsigemmobacter intermedius]